MRRKEIVIFTGHKLWRYRESYKCTFSNRQTITLAQVVIRSMLSTFYRRILFLVKPISALSTNSTFKGHGQRFISVNICSAEGHNRQKCGFSKPENLKFSSAKCTLKKS